MSSKANAFRGGACARITYLGVCSMLLAAAWSVADVTRASAQKFYENPNCYTSDDGAYQRVEIPEGQASSTAPPKDFEFQPYCRTAVEGNRRVAVYWPLQKRRIVMFLAAESCDTSCVKKNSSNVLVKALEGAMNEWNTRGETCSDVSFVYGGMSSTIYSNNKYYKNPNGQPDLVNSIRWRETEWDDDAQRLAVTTLRYQSVTGEIIDADIDFNGVNFDWSDDETINYGSVDIQGILTHELGHVVGFAHVRPDQTHSVMAPSASGNGRSQRSLEDGDVQGICEVYPSGEYSPGEAKISYGGLQGDSAGGCQVVHGGAPSFAWLAAAIALAGSLAFRSRRKPRNRS